MNKNNGFPTVKQNAVLTGISTVAKQDLSPNSTLVEQELARVTAVSLYSNRIPGSGKSDEIKEIEDTVSASVLDIDEGIEFPEGGAKAYLMVFGSFLGLLPAFGLVNSIGPIQTYVSTHQLSNVSASTISWIFSIYLAIASGSSIFSGALFDRTGTRIPMIIGTALFTGGLFATANSTTVYQFILGFGVVGGIGVGMVMSPLVGVISHYFKKNRATACSIATTGGSVGGVIFPVLLRKLYAELGFQWAMRVFALMCLFCLISSTLIIKERLYSVKSENENSYSTFFKNIFDFKAFKDPKFIFCCLGVSLCEDCLLVSSIYFASYAIHNGISENTSYLLVTVLNATGILGRYIPGILADKLIGSFNVAIITVWICVILNLVIWLPFGKNLSVLYVYASLYGFCSGSILSLSPVCCGQISRTDEFGKRYSTCYLIVSISLLASIPIGGAIVGDETNFNNLIIYSSMLGLAGSICYALSRYCCVGFRICKF